MGIDAGAVYGGSYLKAGDIAAPRVLQIGAVELVTLPEDKHQKLAVTFVGIEQKLLLNVTNNNTIVSLYGRDVDGWIGKHLEVFPTTTDYQGSQVACLRVRQPAAAQQAPWEVQQMQQPVAQPVQPAVQQVQQPVAQPAVQQVQQPVAQPVQQVQPSVAQPSVQPPADF